MRVRVVALGLILAAGVVAAAPEVEVVALFKDAALLEIGGKRQLLKPGERSDEGVLLVSADSRQAEIEIDGDRFQVGLSSRIGTAFQPAESSSVTISLNDAGQYRTTGSINDRPVPLLVDTGANIVAINAGDARGLGIDFVGEGRRRQVVTAGGVVDSWQVTLDSVQLGDIRVNNVEAVVLEGGFPETILLGMTFLRNVEIRESGGVLVLTSKL